MRLMLTVAVLAGSILAFGEEPKKHMTLSVITENENAYFADGPIYVDLVLSNDTSNEMRLPPYPRLAAREFPSFVGSGLVINLKDEAGSEFAFGKKVESPDGMVRVHPPDWVIREGELWRWTVDIRSILKWQPWEKDKRFRTGEFEMTISLGNEGIESTPVKISLVRGGEAATTAQAIEALRNKTDTQNPILKPDVLEKTELNKQVLPTFRRAMQAFVVLGKVQKGEGDSPALVKLPSENDWGIWADDIAVARYAHAVRTDENKAKQIRKETEAKFPGTRWLLDKIENDPHGCWLYPIF